MTKGKMSFTMRQVLTFGILLFLANTVLGFVVLNQSKYAMQQLINKDMLDVVKSAAGSLDGDTLGALTEEDVDGPAFRDIEERLLVFQDSVDIHFIYAVKQLDEDTYVFTVDPDPVDPGEFGEEVLTTPALVAAAQGTPTVDEEPAQDRWGNFYSAYSPVFDSSGAVAGVVGIDFDAEWYDGQVQQYTVSIAFVTALSVTFGAIVIVLITNRVRRRFRDLDEGIEELSGNVDLLMDEVAAYSGSGTSERVVEEEDEAEATDELEALGSKIRTMQTEMQLYLEYLREQAYTDALTHVGNNTAYLEALGELERQVAEGTADFCVVIFDINSLKELNDVHGHECGNLYIQGAARAIQQAFGDGNTYRVGGDEFVAIVTGPDEGQVEQGLESMDRALADFNAASTYPVKLSISRGTARYEPGRDASYKDVFARADHIMYRNKRDFYRTEGDRRGRSTRDLDATDATS